MRIYLAVETAAAWLAAGLLALSGGFLTYEVVARYFFGAPTIWTAELSQLCLIWACPIAMAWVLSTRRHIRVTALSPSKRQSRSASGASGAKRPCRPPRRRTGRCSP